MSLGKFVCGFFKRNCLGLQKFLPRTHSCWVLQPEVMGTYLSGTGTLCRGLGVGLGLLTPRIFLPNFYQPHVYVGPAHSESPPFLLAWMDVVFLIP